MGVAGKGLHCELGPAAGTLSLSGYSGWTKPETIKEPPPLLLGKGRTVVLDVVDSA